MPYIVSCEEDNWCLVRSILLGRLLHVDKQEFKKRSQANDAVFTNQVKKYALQMELPESEIGLGLEYIAKIEDNLQFQVIVYRDAEKEPIYWRKEIERQKIYLVFNSLENHFSLIKNISAYFGYKYFCDKCMKIYSTVNAHRCAATCKTCFRLNCDKQTDLDPCVCGAMFKNEKCQFYHAQVCKVARRCPTCTALMPYKRKHVCFDQKNCSNCDQVVPIDHKCFIKKAPIESKVKFKGLGFFDFETYETEKGNQKVNLAIAKRVCLKCYNGGSGCTPCSQKYVFYNIADFVSWLKAHDNKEFIWFAHNASGFDSQFVLEEIYKHILPTDTALSIIKNGGKILELKFASFIIRDSACFLPMPLSQFPAAFNIQELKKGKFSF
jgi:hypothetical protein